MARSNDVPAAALKAQTVTVQPRESVDSAETGYAPVPGSAPPLRLVPDASITLRRGRRIAIAAAAVILTALGAAYWWTHRAPGIPAGIAWSNGRIEADEIDIETKFAGRIAEVFADDGDKVTAGQMVARIDTRDLEASMERDQSTALEAERTLDEVHADIAQQQTAVGLAQKQLTRTQALLKGDYATHELFDEQSQALDGARAGLAADVAKLTEAEAAAAAAAHQVELDQINIADDRLIAPKDGRIEFRVSNIGEVLGAGGKVFTMLDLSYIYMDIYLPTGEAGRVRLGADARIVLDARPDRPIPAQVTFVATQAQFTPKAVETKSERDKLMFRVRVRLDPARALALAGEAGTGLPGLAYIRLDPSIPWPAQLQPKS
jgi:HlyD family secretion protein